MSELSGLSNPKKLLQILLAVIFIKLTVPAFGAFTDFSALGDQVAWLLVAAASVYSKRSLAQNRYESQLHTSVSRLSTFLLIFALVMSFLNGLGSFFTGLFAAGTGVEQNGYGEGYISMLVAAATLVGGIYFGFLGKKVSSTDE